MITTVGLVTISSHINFVHSLRRVQLFVTPWTGTCQASLSFTVSQSLLRFMSIELMMLSKYLILCFTLLHVPSAFPRIRVFFSESALLIEWLKYWNFNFSPSNEYSGLISFRIDWISLLYKGLWRVFSTTVWKPQFFGTQPSLRSDSHVCIWLLEKP